MTDSTSHDHDHEPRWWLTLDDGELLAVDDRPPAGARRELDGHPVLLRLPAWRARDLSRVLDAYTRIVALVSEAAEVSGTEAQLSSALYAAGHAAADPPRDVQRTQPIGVTSGARLRAMATVQAQRPELSHAALIGVVDAAARWLDERENDLAAGLLEAAAGEEAGRRAWEILLAVDRPAPPGNPA